MNALTDKVALITGSARGLGQAIAERYAALGANIILNYSKDKAGADQVVSTIQAMGRRVVAIQADVSKVAEIRRLFAEAKHAFGQIDIVVANAGIELSDVPVVEFTEEQFDQLFNINTKGTYFTMQEAARHIEDHGRIIYVASSTTSYPMQGMGVYGGSKTTPKYLVEVLAKEIGHRGVTVNSIVPYAVEGTGMFSEDHYSHDILVATNPMKRLATPEDVANVAEFFASGLSSFVNGQHLLVHGGAPLA